MIVKRVDIFKRWRKTWEEGSGTHVQSVVRETWLMFGIIPLYIRYNVQTTNL